MYYADSLCPLPLLPPQEADIPTYTYIPATVKPCLMWGLCICLRHLTGFPTNPVLSSYEPAPMTAIVVTKYLTELCSNPTPFWPFHFLFCSLL